MQNGFTPANAPHVIAALQTALGADAIAPAPARYLEDPRAIFTGCTGMLLRPRTPEEIAEILRIANAHRVAVVPYGGGTGLVGGQIMPGAMPLVISLERMDKIRATYAEENIIEVDAGAILGHVHAAAEAVGRLFPLSLASEGSARIGGLLGTNAGGVNVLRYGNARDLCLGLEAVLPTGEIWRGLSRLRKDNTGYDLRNLLIGAEGTLGIITGASLKLFSAPKSRATAAIALADPAAAVALLDMARTELGETISAFEVIARQSGMFLRETCPEIRLPFADIPDWMVLIEIGLPVGDAGAAMEALFLAAHEAGLAQDGVIAQNEAQRGALWAMREHIPVANKRIGAISSHDISVPISRIPAFIADGTAMLAQFGAVRVNCFGHLGDGNLHFNVFPPVGEGRAQWLDRRGAIKGTVHDLVARYGGSFSAEHGVGRFKTGDLERYGSGAKLAAMRTIKAALDPNGIMNPGAVLA